MNKKLPGQDLILAADVGGTSINFGIVRFRRGQPDLLFSRREPTAETRKFTQLVKNALAQAREHRLEPRAACFAAAGPVEQISGHQRVRMTNADLVIDTRELARRTPIQDILVINDFQAVSYATNHLGKNDCFTLNPGHEVRGAARAVIGAGTGLGKSILHYHPGLELYLPLPSEGGHSDLPLTNAEELDLADFIRRRRKLKGPICYEDVLSGRGLEDLYQYLRDSRFPFSPPELFAAEISRTRKSNSASRAAFRWFVRFYARCARNLALDCLAVGGIYLGGGIAARNPDIFSTFWREFIRNETYREMLRKIPVRVIINPDLGLLGAAQAWRVKNLL